jgi:hypothetical protein
VGGCGGVGGGEMGGKLKGQSGEFCGSQRTLRISSGMASNKRRFRLIVLQGTGYLL